MGVLRDLGLRDTAALVSSNGTVTRTHAAELLHRHHMPLATARWLCAHAADFRNSLVFTFDTIVPDGREEAGALVMEQRNDLQQNIGRWMEANRHAIRVVGRHPHGIRRRCAGQRTHSGHALRPGLSHARSRSPPA